jgi:hypothetical protein
MLLQQAKDLELRSGTGWQLPLLLHRLADWLSCLNCLSSAQPLLCLTAAVLYGLLFSSKVGVGVDLHTIAWPTTAVHAAL